MLAQKYDLRWASPRQFPADTRLRRLVPSDREHRAGEREGQQWDGPRLRSLAELPAVFDSVDVEGVRGG